jgi:hypothetical protein
MLEVQRKGISMNKSPYYALQLAHVSELLIQAGTELNGIAKEARSRNDWAIHGDILDVSLKISAILESDHGEAGLIPWLKKMAEEK